MTHILISISDIQNKISELKQRLVEENLKVSETEYSFKDWEYEEAKEKANKTEDEIHSLRKLLTDYKQIALDDKSIKELAEKAYPESGELMQIYNDADNDLRKEGYSQALKNLL